VRADLYERLESLNQTSAQFPIYRSQAALAELSLLSNKPTILMVEDEAGVRGLLRTVLERTGHRILEAGSAKEAIRLWQDHCEEVSLAILDMRIPGGMSGAELANQLKVRRPQLRFVYISGYGLRFAQEWGLPLDAVFLQKPFPPAKLINAVQTTLAN
jgi:CheY-like chemotaxis protein